MVRNSRRLPKGKPVEVGIPVSIEELSCINGFKMNLKGIAGVTSTEIDFEEGKSQYAISVDTLEARRSSLNISRRGKRIAKSFYERCDHRN